jgi:hypothetical protein
MSETRRSYWSLWGPGTIRRKILVVLAILALAFLLVHTAASWILGRSLASTVDRVQEHHGSMSLSTLYPPDVLGKNNRARVVRAATELVSVDMNDRRILSDYLSLTDGDATPENTAAVDAILERHRLAFDLLAAAAERTQSNWEIPYREGVSAKLPNLLAVMNLSRLNVARGIRLARQGRLDAAAEAAEQGLAMAESLAAEPVLIVQLIRISVDRMHLSLIREILERGELPAETLERLQGWVESVTVVDPVKTGNVGEMKMFYRVIRAYERGETKISPGDSWIARSRLIAWLARPVLRSDLRFFLEQMDRGLAWQSVPRHRREAEFGPGSPLAEARWYQPLSKVAVLNLEGVAVRGDKHQARAILATAALASRRYRMAKGSYPKELSELVPEYMTSVPVDPFTGTPLEYRRENGGFFLRSEGDAIEPEVQQRYGDDALRWEIPR